MILDIVKQLFLGLMVLVWTFLPASGWSAMNTLTNTRLGQVQADAGNPSLSPPAAANVQNDQQQPVRNDFNEKEEPAGNDISTKIKAFQASRAYTRFMQSCRQLEKLSKRDDYHAWANSKGFQSFCAKLIKISRQCSIKLTELQHQVSEEAIHPFIDMQTRIHRRINQFAFNFDEYLNGRGPLPEIKKLMEDLRADSTGFQTDYPQYN